MRNYIIISAIIIFLVPLNASAVVDDETLERWVLETSGRELIKIDDANDIRAYASAVIRNSNGDLVGVSHVKSTHYLDHPILVSYLEEHPIFENVTIEGTEYEIRSVPITFGISPDFCYDKTGVGQGTIQDKCFFYSFNTGWALSFEYESGKHRVDIFTGLHHGIIHEEGDRIHMIWNGLIPTN